MEKEKKEEVKLDEKTALTDEEAEAVVGGIQSKDFYSKICEVIAQTPSLTPTSTTQTPKPYL